MNRLNLGLYAVFPRYVSKRWDFGLLIKIIIIFSLSLEKHAHLTI